MKPDITRGNVIVLPPPPGDTSPTCYTVDDVQRAIERITLPTSHLCVKLTVIPLWGPMVYLAINYRSTERDSGRETRFEARRQIRGLPLTENQVIRKALAFVLYIHEHEALESFLVDGNRLFDPHLIEPSPDYRDDDF